MDNAVSSEYLKCFKNYTGHEILPEKNILYIKY